MSGKQETMLTRAAEAVLQHAWDGETYEPKRLTTSDLKLLSAALFQERTGRTFFNIEELTRA